MFLHEWGHAVRNIFQPSAHIPFYRWRKFLSLVSLVNILIVLTMWLQQSVNTVRLILHGRGSGFPGSIPQVELQHEEDTQDKCWSVESDFSQGTCAEQQVVLPEPDTPQGSHFHSCALVDLMVSGLPFLTAGFLLAFLGSCPPFQLLSLEPTVQLLLQKESSPSRNTGLPARGRGSSCHPTAAMQ